VSSRLVLAFDTATAICGVALLGTGPEPEVAPAWVRLAVRTERVAHSATRRLLSMVQECLGDVGAEAGDLGAIVVGIGPGTFTGVRIGVATARAAGFALDIPVIGLSTLSAFAAAAAQGPRGAVAGALADGPAVIVPVCDARRGQLFAAFYERGADARWSRRDDPVALEPAALAEAAAARAGGAGALLIGDIGALAAPGVSLPAGVVVVRAEIAAEYLVDGQEHLIEPGDRPAGRRLGPWLLSALSRLLTDVPSGVSADAVLPGAPGSPEGVVPLYVRAPDAELHITKMRDPWAT
jgi:tRNA threonylcarbamoyladenosine biosynthesis protein TsaB